MHVFVWNSIQFVKSNNIEIRQIEVNSKQKCVCILGVRFVWNSIQRSLSTLCTMLPHGEPETRIGLTSYGSYSHLDSNVAASTSTTSVVTKASCV